jgi:hypothetical protein
MRHLQAFWSSGEDFDVCSNDPDGCSDGPEGWVRIETDTCYNHTGSHHMTAVAWHAFALLEFIEQHPEHDDRYKHDPLEGFDFNEVAYSREDPDPKGT